MENKKRNTMTRSLKYGEWKYDFDEDKLYLFVVDRSDPEAYWRLEMGRTYAFSLGRFLISVWQKLARGKRVRARKHK